ncbi:MAG: radical SAM family heme chaperone HemW [Bacteroidota bacterium]
MFSKLYSKFVNQKSLSGVYIHIPFCKQACHYCNFHFSTSKHQRSLMVESIAKEIALTPFISEAEKYIETIYFGGGTPSILNEKELASILNALHEKFSISSGAEITLEANPDDITPSALQQWKALGINRLSTGIQSFVEAELKWMNRAHNANEALACIDHMKQAGFDNYSIDLIYGSPLLDDEAWANNVQMAITQNIPHISCYALTVEPKTALDKMIRDHKKSPVDPERQARQFLLLINWMKEAGYEHYEISNFARPGMRSRHNSSYWQGKSYYGFGPSAHSFTGHARKWNVANNSLYIQSLQKNVIPYEEELLTPTQQLNEYIMISLRTSEGINLQQIQNSFNQEAADNLLKTAEPWIQGKKVELRDRSLVLTTEGKLFADGIAADLFT